ncbi:hypothetical protein CEXT_762621 [Caerostris extrusa]|uniref:Uncharacterized protein n=1 Tax=Caerostris extrusa TaxID=172846 RepID=A0AAV4S2B5_CAEEX|nr:hypothetical protein CEXT_762621 [Caerostris extrusa]
MRKIKDFFPNGMAINTKYAVYVTNEVFSVLKVLLRTLDDNDECCHCSRDIRKDIQKVIWEILHLYLGVHVLRLTVFISLGSHLPNTGSTAFVRGGILLECARLSLCFIHNITYRPKTTNDENAVAAAESLLSVVQRFPTYETCTEKIVLNEEHR